MDLTTLIALGALVISGVAICFAWKAEKRAKRLEEASEVNWVPSAKMEYESVRFTIRSEGATTFKAAQVDASDLAGVRITWEGMMMALNVEPGKSVGFAADLSSPSYVPDVLHIEWKRKNDTKFQVSSVVTDSWKELLEEDEEQ